MTVWLHDIRVVLCIATVFCAGVVWWCEDCGGGGFIPEDVRAHRGGCRLRGHL